MLRKISTTLFATTLKNKSTTAFLLVAPKRFYSEQTEQQEEQQLDEKPVRKPFKRPVNYSCRVFVGNLSYSTKWQDLKAHAESVGEVKFASIMQDENGRSKGCGIIEFTSPEAASKAIEALHESELQGRKMVARVDKAPEARPPKSDQGYEPKKPRQFDRFNNNSSNEKSFGAKLYSRAPRDTKNVYVGNLGDKVSEEEVANLLSSIGKVENVAFKVSKTGHFAIATFENVEDAKKAAQELNQKQVNGQVLIVREDKKY